MRFIHYGKDGKMLGHFANPQTYAEKGYPDDHPDIVAWEAAREAAKKARRLEAEKRGEEEKALYSRVAALEKALLKQLKKPKE